jgi:hypothetical protein
VPTISTPQAMVSTLRFAHPHFNRNENAARDWAAF